MPTGHLQYYTKTQKYNTSTIQSTCSAVGNTLAPYVSSSLRAKPGCGCPAWQSCHWVLSCVAA